MVRDLRRLSDTRFDLLVIGAGFYGAVAAWDATLRGLSVAIIDQGDFGSGTSFNNLKTLHGGLRSLQSLNVSQMRLFIRERRALARVAPHLVRPMPFVVPTYRHPTRAASVMRLALAINDRVARDRHDGLADPALHLPPSRVVSRADCLQINPVIDPRGVTGGALWHDYQMHNTDRMTLAFVLSAAERGAAAANYVSARGLIQEAGRVAGVGAVDALTSERFDVRARTVINAAGPWAASLLQTFGVSGSRPAPLLSRAMNLVMRAVGTTHGCGGLVRGRFLFLVPWRDVSLLGTSHDVHEGTPDSLTATSADVERYIADAREAFPRAHLQASDVRLVHRGLLPMVSGRGDHVNLLRESAIVDHRRDQLPGLVSMFGVRYTTARHTAAQAVDAVFRDHGIRVPPASPTAEVPVAGGDIEDKERFVRDVLLRYVTAAPEDTLQRLALTYGTRFDRVVARMERDPALAGPLGQTCRVTGAEIQHAVRDESAITLRDALIRRTEAGSAGHPGDDAVAAAAAIMGRELGWDEARIAREIRAFDAFYALSE
jgi:glycerol-3-phosphate dehydrogenase